MSAQRRALSIIAAGVTVAAVYGWKLFFFLTDDAHIAFRYVANSLAGHGLVWNVAPFQPVEGYTSFLWVILLREVWRVTGIEPPESSVVLGLLFGLGTLFLVGRMLLQLRLPPRMEPWRLPFLCIAMAGILLNRTFLAWLSSGLETAFFNFLVTWWVYEGTRDAPPTPARLARLAISASLSALCRPDGLLLVAATAVQLIVSGLRPAAALLAGTPLLLVPAHILWRWTTYGDWLPNTFRAKYSRLWPESGLRYLGSFALEYAVWVWLLLLVAWVVRLARGRVARPPMTRSSFIAAITVLTLLAHGAYYTFAIGGDHFEFRVYSHLVPLLFVSAVWLLVRAVSQPGVAAAILASWVVLSCPIPWMHWWLTKDLSTRRETIMLDVAVAPHLPPPFSAVAALWDDWQSWLIHHAVCLRHQEHKVFWQWQMEKYPPREVGLEFGRDQRTVFEAAMGIAAWELPNTAIIDSLGLNDAIVARQGIPVMENRLMGHDRRPPPGYVACFRPNVALDHRQPTVIPGKVPVTDDEIRACQSRDWRQH